MNESSLILYLFLRSRQLKYPSFVFLSEALHYLKEVIRFLSQAIRGNLSTEVYGLYFISIVPQVIPQLEEVLPQALSYVTQKIISQCIILLDSTPRIAEGFF